MKLSSENFLEARILNLSDGNKIVTVNTYGLNNLSDEDYNNNIYCVDNNNNIVWRICAPKSQFGRESFVAVVKDGDSYVAIRQSGYHFSINKDSGELVFMRITR